MDGWGVSGRSTSLTGIAEWRGGCREGLLVVVEAEQGAGEDAAFCCVLRRGGLGF